MRRSSPFFSLFTVLFLFFISSLPYALNLTRNNTPTQVHFSPHLGGTEAITRERQSQFRGLHG